MPLTRLAELYGVATSYSPSPGQTVPVAEDAVIAALGALGVDAGSPEAVRAALAVREADLAARLLPPTVVWWQGRDPVSLAGLPAGTRLRVTTEDGAAHDWAVQAAEPVQSLRTVSAAEPPPAGEDGTAGAPLPPAPPPGEPIPEPRSGGGWPQLPLGVHTLIARTTDGRSARAHLVVAPLELPVPAERAHGLLVQLYSLLSRRSWGMGDLADLAELASWSRRVLGTGFIQVNPLHSAVPGDPTDPSPYRPSTRRFPDPVHLRVEAVDEYAYLTGADRQEAASLAARAAALRAAVLDDGALIDRDAVWELKRRALELVHRVPLAPGRQAAFGDFLAAGGQRLDDHATWCALAELYGPDWHRWPEGLREPGSAATERARRELAGRVEFYLWLAWLTDAQLAAAQRAATDAGMPIGLVHDLAVGVHPDGSDTWALRGHFAEGMSTGAPPDAFNARGQDWGLPPWRPDRLAESGYAPFRDLLAALFRRAGGLRVDHVMGLFRLWWVPAGRPPTDGTYVHYDAEAMLAVLALEAHRAGALVIGEDLGTVAPGVREALREHGVLGTSVLWFERDWDGGGAPLAPGQWRADCLATATTHDLPPTASRLTGGHVDLRAGLGLLTRPAAEERAAAGAETEQWLRTLTGLGLLAEGAGEEEEIRAVHRFLLRTPALLVGVWLPDALGDRRPQNVPGTSDEYPNWRLPVADAAGTPVALEELTASPRLHALLEILRGG